MTARTQQDPAWLPSLGEEDTIFIESSNLDPILRVLSWCNHHHGVQAIQLSQLPARHGDEPLCNDP